MSLIEYGREPGDSDYASKIQTFNRFLIDQLTLEGNNFPQNPRLIASSMSMTPTTVSSSSSQTFLAPAAAPITQLLGIDAKTIIHCDNCGARREKEIMTHVLDILYPKDNGELMLQPFADLLRSSILRHLTYKATCQSCKQLSSFHSRRTLSVADLPAVLTVNACVYNHNEDTLRQWLDQRGGQPYLSSQVTLTLDMESNYTNPEVTYELRV